jgi:hypothetical protein
MTYLKRLIINYCTSGSKAFSQSNPFFVTSFPDESRAFHFGFLEIIGPPASLYEDEKPY